MWRWWIAFRVRRMGVFGLVASCLGCGVSRETESLHGLAVVGGLEVPDGEWQEVVRITQNGAVCTAVFVSQRTLLTAAHCLEDGGAVRVQLPSHTETASLYYIHPSYRVRWWEHDLAVVQLDRDAAPAFSLVSAHAPVVGNDLQIVGYGTSSLYGSGTFAKRYGNNVVRSVGNGRIAFRGYDEPGRAPEGMTVLNAPGDSGGPMYVDGNVVGVSSSISVEPRGQGRNGYYSDLHHPPNLSFLRQLVDDDLAQVSFAHAD